MRTKRIVAWFGGVAAVIGAPAIAQAPPAAPVTYASQPATPPGARAPARPASTSTLPILESETSDTASMGPLTPHRFYVVTGYSSIAILDGDTAKMLGTLNAAYKANFAIAPDYSEYYVPESIWSMGNRGTRQDVISIYEPVHHKILAELPLPGRLIATGRIPHFDIDVSGRRGFVYNVEPAPSVIAVDLKKRKVLSKIEIPGCGLVFPFKDAGFASLCADGSLTSVAVDAAGKAVLTHSPVFFDAQQDPVFEESINDKKNARALFITYTGMVYPASLGPTSTVEPGWSLQRAANMGAATTQPQDKTWRPGGRHPFAYHRDTGLLYVLMHDGKHWTQKAPGSEVWVVDTKAHKLVTRYEVPGGGVSVDISQDAAPQLYVMSQDGTFWVIAPDSGRVLRSLTKVGRPLMTRVVGY